MSISPKGVLQKTEKSSNPHFATAPFLFLLCLIPLFYKLSDFSLHFIKITVRQDGDQRINFLNGLIPPLPFQHQGCQLIIKASAYCYCGIRDRRSYVYSFIIPGNRVKRVRVGFFPFFIFFLITFRITSYFSFLPDRSAQDGS